MLFRNPINVYPHNVTIDPNQQDTYFSFTFKGDRLSSYVFRLYEYSNTPLETQGESKIYEKLITQSYFELEDYQFNDSIVTVPINMATLHLLSGKTYTWDLALGAYDDGEQFVDEHGFQTAKYCFKTAFRPTISQDINALIQDIDNDDEGSFIINGTPAYYPWRESNPVLDIGIIQNRMIDFEAYYVLDALVSSCKYYYCRLSTEDGEVVDETNKIFSSHIRYTFNGLLSNQNYSLELFIVSQTDQYLHLTLQFLVQYSSSDNLGFAPELQCNIEDNSIDIKWVRDYTAIGKATGQYQVIDSQVDIQSGEIIYDKIANQNLASYQDFTIAFKTTINDLTTKILTYVNENVTYEIYMENYKFYLKYGSEGIVTEIGNFKNNIVFGIQNYNTPENNTGYMWYDNTTFDTQEANADTYLLTAIIEERKFNFILSKTNNEVECHVEEVVS